MPINPQLNRYILKRHLPESGGILSAGTLSIGTAGGGCVRSAAFFRWGEVEGEGVSRVELRILPDALRNACPIYISNLFLQYIYPLFSSLLFSFLCYMYVCMYVYGACVHHFPSLNGDVYKQALTPKGTLLSPKRIYNWVYFIKILDKI